MPNAMHATMKALGMIMCILSLVASLVIGLQLHQTQAPSDDHRLVLQALCLLCVFAAFLFLMVADTAHRAQERERRLMRR